MKTKTISESKVVMANVMLPQHANPAGNVHGGEIIKMMDNAAGAVAQRHARTNVVTARIDEVKFILPIRIGDVVTCYGQLTYVGRTSMEILITVTVEDLSKDESPKTALTAFFTLVSLDENGTPQPVASLEITTEEERKAFEEGRLRYLAHKSKEK
ncbi:MAG: acyl-CoA hydrolase [Firmicutes bacterium]|nr:acyl-CoA hydrolase [Bacillota bacterium]